jgi:hypothetical protein
MAVFLPALCAGCGLDTEGMLIETDTTVSDDDGTDGDGSMDVDVDDNRPDGDVPHDLPRDDGMPPDVPDVEADGPLTCASAPAYCEDWLDCTTDVCTDDAAGPRCSHVTLPGFCLIDGTCFTAWFINLDNECQICDPSVNNAWTPVADRTQCYWGGGICCSGWCIPNANCFSDDDCEGCTGTAALCESIMSEDSCWAQSGCTWTTSGHCSGGSACSTWSSNAATCNSCGCYHDGGDCDPDDQVHDCSGYSSADCASHRMCGCSWVDTGGLCSGTPLNCWELDSSACGSQSGCSWGESGICNPTTFICEYTYY